MQFSLGDQFKKKKKNVVELKTVQRRATKLIRGIDDFSYEEKNCSGFIYPLEEAIKRGI